MLESLKNPKNPIEPECYPNFSAIACDMNTPAVPRTMAEHVCVLQYASVAYMLNTISPYDLNRMIESVEAVFDSEESIEDNIERFGVCYELSTAAMVMSASEGAFHDFLEMSTQQMAVVMYAFLYVEMVARMADEDEYLDIPELSFDMDEEMIQKLYEDFIE